MLVRAHVFGMIGLFAVAAGGCKPKDNATETKPADTASSKPTATAADTKPAASAPEVDDPTLKPEERAKAMIPRMVDYDLGATVAGFKGWSVKAPPGAILTDLGNTIWVRGSEHDVGKFVGADVYIKKEKVDLAALKGQLQADAKKGSIKSELTFGVDTPDALEWTRSSGVTVFGFAKHVKVGGVDGTCQTNGAAGGAAVIVDRAICETLAAK